MSSTPTVICGKLGERRLCAVQVPAGISVTVYQAADCPQAAADCACRPSLAIIGGNVGDQAVESALRKFGACAERDCATVLVGENMEEALKNKGLYMALSTSTAYGGEPAHLFCVELAHRLGLSPEARDNIELALHEAIVNGLLHGNLEVSSYGRDTMDGFAEYCHTVDAHLHDPDLSARPLEVFATWTDQHIEISVVDCGRGYDPDALPANHDPNRKSGRGLLLIREIADSTRVSEGGRRMTMRFHR